MVLCTNLAQVYHAMKPFLSVWVEGKMMNFKGYDSPIVTLLLHVQITRID